MRDHSFSVVFSVCSSVFLITIVQQGSTDTCRQGPYLIGGVCMNDIKAHCGRRNTRKVYMLIHLYSNLLFLQREVVICVKEEGMSEQY